MATKQPANRIDRDLKRWEQKEKAINAIFPTKTKVLLEEKLAWYNSIEAKYRKIASKDERIWLRVVRSERRDIERQLYPKRFLRLFNRLVTNPIKQRLQKQQKKLHDERQIKNRRNPLLIRVCDEVRQRISKNGFNLKDGDRLEYYIANNVPQFTLTATRLTSSGQTVDFKIPAIRQSDGSYQLGKYTATLRDELNPALSKTQRFSDMDNIDAGMACSLLEGKSVAHPQIVTGRMESRWIQLDFNDKAPDGSAKVNEYSWNHQEGINKLLRWLPVRELLDGKIREDIWEQLCKGERIPATAETAKGPKQLYIEADPARRSIALYDDKMKRTTAAEILGKNVVDQKKAPSQQVRTKQKKGVSH